MSWNSDITEFGNYLKIEKGLSPNSVEAYVHDISKLLDYFEVHSMEVSASEVNTDILQHFLQWLASLGAMASSQARIVSGIKAFYNYRIIANEQKHDPSELLEAPKLGRKLPDVLTHEEIEKLIAAVDLSSAEGERNKAILEVLYSCGLRVSELTDLKISNLYLSEEFIRVRGKGSKERLVPIGESAINQLNRYLNEVRNLQKIEKGHEDFVFLNRRGKSLTRVMVFTIVKNLALTIGLTKKISPHTFRHSFATELIERGANLRAVQEMLGHESILTTEIYTHLNREFLRSTILMYHPREKK